MNQNSNKSSGWTLCPSKRFPGKFHYFNGLTDETAWSVSDTDVKSLDKHPNRRANQPEPSYRRFIPETPRTPYNFEKPKSCLKKSNFKSPPIISSTQENYSPNPYNFSNQNITNDYPDFATHSTPDFPIKSHPNDFATHSTLDFHPSHPNNSSTSNKLSDFSLNSLINFATPSNSNDLSSNLTDFTIPCNSSSVTPAIRLPLLKLAIPTSTKTTDNLPKFIWAPIPIEYVNDQIYGKTQVNKINGPTFVTTEQPLTRTVKNHPLINLNETDITSQSIINFNKEEIRPKTDNLELIKKFRHKFNSNDINNSNSKIQTNLNPISEPITTKIIRKINKIPEYESKITKTLEFESRITKTPKCESRITKTPQFHSEITKTPQFESEIITTLEFESEVTKTPEFETKISSKEVSPKKTLCQGDTVQNREDYLDNLSEKDLRYVLLKRRLEQNKKNKVSEKKARSDREVPVTPKKKVTFQLDFSDEETNQEFIDDEEPEQPTNSILSQLRRLGEIENKEWYIVVDLNVVQESFDFLLTFVQDDPLCNLLIPYSVYKWLSTLCVGESCGARLVQFARQALRRIDFAVKSEWVQVEKLTDSNEETLPRNAQILNCCFKLIYNNIHVVLITDSNILYKKALDNGIYVYKIEEIQYVDNEPDKNTDKNTQLKVIGENVTGPKNTRLNNTQTKDTEVTSTHLEDVVVNDTISKVFNRNTMLRQFLLKLNEPINTQLKVTKENSSEIKDTRENHTKMKDTTEKDSILEIESNFKPVTSKTIRDELKRFYITDEIVQQNFETRIDEYYCIFRQSFERLYDIIKDIPTLKCDGNKIWSLHDVLQVLRNNGDKKIQLISEKMIDLLHEYDYQGTANMKIKLNSEEVIQVIGCGILLVKKLKEFQETPELLDLATDLNNLLNSVQNPEVTPPNVPKIYRTDKQRDRKNFIKTTQRNNKLKPRKEIIDYVKKHFPQWKGHEDNNEDKPSNTTHKSSKVKVVRTSGKNISLIELNRTKILMVNAPENTEPKTINALETEKNNSKNDEMQIQNDKISDLKNQNVVSSTEPIVIRTLNGFAQENEIIDYNLNETKHQNTLGVITNGPKVICKIAPIKEFEERIKNDLDKLDYSKTSNTESELSIKTDGIIEENMDENIVENVDENISLTNDIENVIKDDTIVHIEDKCLNGEKNRITKTIALKTSLNEENTRTNSLNDENKTNKVLNDKNKRINSLNNGSTTPISLNERLKSLNESINSVTDESKGDSSKRVFENTSNIKELNSPIIKRTFFIDDSKRTGSLNETRKRNDSLTSSTHNDERCSSIGTKSTKLLIENSKRTGSFDRTRSLSPCVSLLSDTEDDIIIIEDDYEPKSGVRFIKSFFKVISNDFNRIICFCEINLSNDLNIKEFKCIHDKALKLQNVLNKMTTLLFRISVREENEGTFNSLFPKDIDISRRYVKIIKKFLNQANLIKLTLEQVIKKTSRAKLRRNGDPASTNFTLP